MDRRKFLAFSFLGVSSLYAKDNRLKIVLPPKPFEYYHIRGKQKGKRVLLVGGIHGNEVGAYKASDLLVNSEIRKGELIILPRTNFTSILANVRGYNGDMNRKFDYISKKDPDYPFVEFLKGAILEFRPDVVISMHDGVGFAYKSKRAWGNSVVIDEVSYRGFDLYNKAKFVLDNSNKYVKRPLALINTKTFSANVHKEQKKALTGWCLQEGIEAYCIEASKQSPSLREKVQTHLIMLREFFKLYDIEIANLDELIQNPVIPKHPVKVVLNINGKRVSLRESATLNVKRGSVIEVEEMAYRSDYLVPRGINLNWRSFHFYNLTLNAQRDGEKVFKVKIKIV